MITKHHFTNVAGNKVDVYWYEDRYRYCVHTDNGIEYRELLLGGDGSYNTFILEQQIIADMRIYPYNEQQLKAKCIRCSKWNGAPRKKYNLAPICNRCYSAMAFGNDISVSSAAVWYEINPDGSKGSVIK